jgi:hypothetical protein
MLHLREVELLNREVAVQNVAVLLQKSKNGFDLAQSAR